MRRRDEDPGRFFGDARLTFSLLLKEAPDYRLDPLYYPRRLTSFFEDEKARLKELGFIGTPQDAPKAPKAPERILIREVVERRTPVIAFLMPFAVGQFANGDDALGAVLAALQAVGLAANVAAWIGVETMGKTVPRSKQGSVEILDGLWIAGTALAGSAYIYSVVDGFIGRPPETETREHYELVPPQAPEAPADTPDVTLRLGPGPGQAGLSLQGSF